MMTPFEIAMTVGVLLALAICWKAVDGVLKQRRADSKRYQVRDGVTGRVAKLEADFSRLPHEVASEDDFDRIATQVTVFGETLRKLEAKAEADGRRLLDREGAERIVTRLNQISLDVEGLKQWQAEQTVPDELTAGLFGVPEVPESPKKEK
jgi:hypothetical protein